MYTSSRDVPLSHSHREETIMRLLIIFFALFVAAAHARAVTAAPPPVAQPIANNLGDVVGATVSSFAIVGGLSGVWCTLSSVVTRKAGPLGLGWQAAKKWGKVSSGFAGGRALGQVIRKKDDLWCGVAGGIFGGAAAASSIADMPSSILSFVAFGLVIDTVLTPSKPPAGAGAANGEKIEWRGKSMDEIRTEAKAKARADYEKRHAGDSTRLRALQK